MKFNGIEFIEAKRLIESVIGAAPLAIPKASKSDEARAEATKDQLAALWGRANPLNGEDIASRYLASRGLACEAWPACLRWLPDLPYRGEDGTKALYPAMLAKFSAADSKSATIHRTYLVEPGVKAPVPQARKLMPGRVPPGSAVRLAPAAETMGLAEGIETALSAAKIFKIPVWAALTAGALMKWTPPNEAKEIIVFGDLDNSFTGQLSAFSLAYRLKIEGLSVSVSFPDKEYITGNGADWNDVIMANGGNPS